MRDFTLAMYDVLLRGLKSGGWDFFRMEDVMGAGVGMKKQCILRHDIDRIPENALKIAVIEHGLDIRASYYFRMVKQSYDSGIIKQIADLGHEIGYHYEDLSLCKGDHAKAIRLFENNLDTLKKLYPVKTICMHGSPLSKWDNRRLWDDYDYKGYGIIGEPYFDIDYNKVFYITDTGRKWNDENSSVRDKVETRFNIKVKNTFHLIELIDQNKLPDQLMINTHPQRWFDMGPMWVKELVLQNVKNVIKQYFFK